MSNIKEYGNSEVVIQLYAKVSDLIRTEYSTLEPGIDEEIQGLLASVKKHGFRDSLKVKPDGLIMRGNGRCEVAKELGIEYLPIDAGFFVGIHTTEKDHVMVIRKIFYEEEIDYINNLCRPVKKPTTDEHRKKIGFNPNQMKEEDYLINWSDEFMFLESHFETVETIQNIEEKKDLLPLEDLLNHWKGCDKIPTSEENCKWCYSLFKTAIDLKEANKNE